MSRMRCHGGPTSGYGPAEGPTRVTGHPIVHNTRREKLRSVKGPRGHKRRTDERMGVECFVCDISENAEMSTKLQTGRADGEGKGRESKWRTAHERRTGVKRTQRSTDAHISNKQLCSGVPRRVRNAGCSRRRHSHLDDGLYVVVGRTRPCGLRARSGVARG